VIVAPQRDGFLYVSGILVIVGTLISIAVTFYERYYFMPYDILGFTVTIFLMALAGISLALAAIAVLRKARRSNRSGLDFSGLFFYAFALASQAINSMLEVFLDLYSWFYFMLMGDWTETSNYTATHVSDAVCALLLLFALVSFCIATYQTTVARNGLAAGFMTLTVISALSFASYVLFVFVIQAFLSWWVFIGSSDLIGFGGFIWGTLYPLYPILTTILSLLMAVVHGTLLITRISVQGSEHQISDGEVAVGGGVHDATGFIGVADGDGVRHLSLDALDESRVRAGAEGDDEGIEDV
jgi:hypothetical protein